MGSADDQTLLMDRASLMSLPRPIVFDRSSGRLDGGDLPDRIWARVLQCGSRVSAHYDRRGFSIGSRVLRPLIGQRDITVHLAHDAYFSYPLGDGYWSLLLDRSFRYEHEIDCVLRAVADVDYSLIDCGANFGFWSVLASSHSYGGHAGERAALPHPHRGR